MAQFSKLRKTIIGIAITLLLAFFWGHAVSTIFEEPKFDKVCQDIQPQLIVETCDNYTSTAKPDRFRGPVPEKECHCYEIDKDKNLQCSAPNPEYQECSKSYEDQREAHEKLAFMILIGLGLLSILAGVIFLKGETVGSGIMGGGVITIIYASMRYWGSIQDYGRLIILGISLGVLIWLGLKKLRD